MPAQKMRRKANGRKKCRQAQLKREPSRATQLKDFFSAGTAVWLYEVLSVLLGMLALFLAISFLSLKYVGATAYPDTAVAVENVMGPLGHVMATLLEGALGWCGLLPAFWAGALAVYCWLRVKQGGAPVLQISSRFLLVLGLLGSLAACAAIAALLGGAPAGGQVGMALALLPHRLVGGGGALLLGVGFLLLSLGFLFQRSSGDVLKAVCLALVRLLQMLFITVPQVLWSGSALGLAWLRGKLNRAFSGTWWGRFFREESESAELLPPPKRRSKLLSRIEVERVELAAPSDPAEVVVRRKGRDQGAADKLGQRQRQRQGRREKPLESESRELEQLPYEAPQLALLTPGENEGVVAEDDETLRRKSRMIEHKLRDFGISGRVTHVHPGPVITLFEFEPAAGVKVGRIASLQDDLAMSLRASSIRIIAPIPRRGTVGIEVPNKQRDVVRLRDVLESEEFVNADSILSVPIGKNIYGEPLVIDIARMPHFLMAGATGTGKSVSINSILISLLYKSSPVDLGLILIDPKILELSVYDGIPHLRVPVVTVPKQAKAVLEWAVKEMNRRYRLMQRFGVRSIDGYNQIARGDKPETEVETGDGVKVLRLSEEDVLVDGTSEPPTRQDQEGDQPTAVEQIRPLPKLLIVIDELADLILTVGREIEDLITRLAQKARASGIHLIVATQRPSVDVITGLIKANFPARMSFRVSSRVDSRTILDAIGAERLLGRGDMLLMLPGAEHIVRAHGAFVSDEEVQRVVQAVKQNAAPQYDPAIVAACEQAMEEDKNSGGGEDGTDNDYDPFYDQALSLVMEKGQASTSMIQRAFRIGYNRAARIIEMMEQEGVVGPINGSKAREVLLEAKDYD